MGAIVAISSFILFLIFQAQGIGGGDSGDLVTAAATMGVAHPPGYPLYTFLGWLLTHVPWATPAWRVGLLSSMAHALVVGIVWLIIKQVTAKKDAAWFGAILLAGNYVFFLYSVTPEVFALLDLFLVLLTWLVVRFTQTGNPRLLYIASFVAGLSLTHHHFIVFAMPVFVGVLIYARKHLLKAHIAPVGIAFFVGLLPYLYVPIAARGTSPINWDHAVNGAQFLRLITRADYGTFQSGGSIGHYPIERLMAVKAYGEYLFLDFRVGGMLFISLGLYWLLKQKTTLSHILPWTLGIMGPFFFFYASFPLSNRFTLGTYERFLLPSYIMCAVLAGIGYARIKHFVERFLRTWAPHLPQKFLAMGVGFVLFLYPVSMSAVTLWRFWGIAQDRTSEHLVEDTFLDIPQGSIIAFSRDTPLFTAQYGRYALGMRPDIYVIHGSFLPSPYHREAVKQAFPELFVPPADATTPLADFLTQNAATRPIFANTKYSVGKDWYWVPHGLLFRLVPANSDEQAAHVLDVNNALWSQTHEPDSGILSRYNHLMLSDARDVYTAGRMEFGKFLLQTGKPGQAAIQFEAAIRAGGDTQQEDAYLYKGLSHLFTNECDAALASFARAREVSFAVSKRLLLFEGFTYRDCVGDASKAAQLFSEFEASEAKESQPLEGW